MTPLYSLTVDSSSALTDRWPGLLGAGIEFAIPCPRCQIRPKDAVSLRNNIVDEIDEALREEAENEVAGRNAVELELLWDPSIEQEHDQDEWARECYR